MGTLSAVTRDYVFDLDETGGAPLFNVFDGKITTFRKLAERGLHRLERIFPQMGATGPRVCRCRAATCRPRALSLSSTDCAKHGRGCRARSFIITGGSTARGQEVVGATAGMSDLGQHYGGLLYDSEARYLVARE